MQLAFRGGQNALPAKARSAFFVVRFFAFLPFVFFGPAWAGILCEPVGPLEPVSVHHVYDGDTLKLDDGRKLRLIGVNATELGREGRPDQPLAKAATRVVESFVRHAGHVMITVDKQAKDRYGRLLAHVFNAQGESLEQQLLEQGLAYHVAVPPNLTLVSCLAQAEQEARDDKLGLWSEQGIAPVRAADVNVGGFQRIQGKVTSIKLDNAWRLTLDNQLIAITYPENQANFDQRWYESLYGQFIEVQGWIYHSRGEWRIKLETAYGIHHP